MPDREAPLPPSADVLVTYHEGLSRGEVRVTRCTDCGLAQFPPRAVCPRCSGVGTGRWETTAGRGRVWSFAVFHKAYLAGSSRRPPYDVAVVQLDEGPKLFTNVVGLENLDLQVGMAVEAVFEEEDGTALVRFRPVGTHSNGIA
jgi:uncharacterized OB-fold protein